MRSIVKAHLLDTLRLNDVRWGDQTAKPMATPEKATDAEGVSFPALSNDELGALWSDTCRSYAVRRTGSSRDFWRKLLDDPDVLAVLAEFKRRAMERQEEYDAWTHLRNLPAS